VESVSTVGVASAASSWSVTVTSGSEQFAP
jgi:hypothetical protein